MRREHLRAGVQEKETGRAHHSKDIKGYVGEPGWQMHGMRYLARNKKGVVVEQEHGISDRLQDGQDHEAVLIRQKAARRSLRQEAVGRFQKLSNEYLRPPGGY